jgi:hypothetical protein
MLQAASAAHDISALAGVSTTTVAFSSSGGRAVKSWDRTSVSDVTGYRTSCLAA